MIRMLSILVLLGLLASCRSSRTITTAIGKKDSTAVAAPATPAVAKVDTQQLIRNVLGKIDSNRVQYRTFNGKVDVDFTGGDGRKNSVKVVIRMAKDSALWMNVNALLGIDAMRVLITKDSVKLIDKINKVYTARSVSYLQEMTSLPLDLRTLQELIIGNPVFLDPNIVAYGTGNGQITLLSLGEFFRNLLTLNAPEGTLGHIKLDDTDPSRSRTADLTYSDYENKKGFPFSTKRRIVVTEKTRLDIKIDYKQYELNGDVSFPFSIPRNYERN